MVIGSSQRGLRRTAAFTLLELVMVIALFGLVAALIVGTGAAMLRESDEASVEQKTISAIASARHHAVLTGEVLELRFDEKTRMLDWVKGSEVLAGDDVVRFLPPAQLSSMLLGGRAVEQSIPFVRFYPDGTCDPFRLEIVQKSVSRITAIDPWTCTALAVLPEGGNRR